jgi:hypothetical protein
MMCVGGEKRVEGGEEEKTQTKKILWLFDRKVPGTELI